MMETRYLGLTLPHPFMVGASPLVDNLAVVRALEDAGTAAIVMHSLYEEQLTGESMAASRHLDQPAESVAEATSYLPELPDFALGPDEYLEQIFQICEAVAVPVIGSLNGVTPGGWLEYARLIEEAGASALEVNLYGVPTDPLAMGWDIEERAIEVVRLVTSSVKIPVAVKLSPFYSALAHFASRLEAAGAGGMVLFNRFYQADIDTESLDVRPALALSRPDELLLRLRWLAILSGQTRASLAVSGGVHSGLDAVKAVMAGADVVQVVSAVLKHGPKRLAEIRFEFEQWVEAHEYESLAQLRGSMNLKRCPDPQAFERASYLRVLQGWRAE